ncbi:MAG: hypothetical protein BGO77_03535 [Caedibacter sp. 37-49]|nr:MAG: hypothetical protein BGO77_03535 [Caedibacter sp. 37-49]
MQQLNRHVFIDYLRGFLVALVVLDHACHAYTEYYSKFWFFPDFETSIFFDIFHLHNDSFMMPSLFFLAGLFVLPSLQRRGYLSFAKERFLRLIIPYLVGLPLISPLLSYPRYLLNENANISYWQYLTEVWVNRLQAGPFWFLYYLVLLSTIAVILYAVVPKLFIFIGRFASWLIEKPLRGFAIFALMSAIILGISDLIWGAPWWIGWWADYKFFYVRGSRFILKAFYFFLGAGFSQISILNNKVFWENLGNNWQKWALFTLGVALCYMSYTLSYFNEGAYSDHIRYYVAEQRAYDINLSDIISGFWPVFFEHAPKVLLRTTLLGIFICSQLVTYLAVFYRFLNKDNLQWASLAAAAYGIYIIHEPFVVWSHWFFYGGQAPLLVRFIVAGFGSLFLSWLIVNKVLLRLPGFKRIL